MTTINEKQLENLRHVFTDIYSPEEGREYLRELQVKYLELTMCTDDGNVCPHEHALWHSTLISNLIDALKEEN